MRNGAAALTFNAAFAAFVLAPIIVVVFLAANPATLFGFRPVAG